MPRLYELLGFEVKMASDCISTEVEKMVGEIPEGGVLLLNIVRFYKEEENNDPEFVRKECFEVALHMFDEMSKRKLSLVLQQNAYRRVYVGEPIMNPETNSLVDELHRRRISTFLVTNAQLSF